MLKNRWPKSLEKNFTAQLWVELFLFHRILFCSSSFVLFSLWRCLWLLMKALAALLSSCKLFSLCCRLSDFFTEKFSFFLFFLFLLPDVKTVRALQCEEKTKWWTNMGGRVYLTLLSQFQINIPTLSSCVLPNHSKILSYLQSHLKMMYGCLS